MKEHINNPLSLPEHPVLQEIQRRVNGDSPQLKLALAVEGGGIRSTVTAGEVCALSSSNIDPLIFDAHFGSSGGAYVAGYYLSQDHKSGATVFYENNRGGEFIDFRQLVLNKRPILSLDHIIDSVLVDKKPWDYQRIIDSQRLHILATKLTDLSRHVFDPPKNQTELNRFLRAGSAIPGVAGEPVEIEGDTFIDASLTEAMPYKAAIDRGYEAVLLLSSRPAHEASPGSGDIVRKLITKAVSRQIKIKRTEILEMAAARKEIDAKNLAELREKTHKADEPPFIFSIHPSSNLPIVKQFEKNPKRVISGTIAGYLAVKQTFGHPQPDSFNTKVEFYGQY